jgi:hypothetical protein
MLRKASILFLMIGIFLALPTEAKEKQKAKQLGSILSPHAKKIISDRVCRAVKTNQYTVNELFSYTYTTIEENADLPKVPALSSYGSGIADGWIDSIAELIESRNRKAIRSESISILKNAASRCQ